MHRGTTSVHWCNVRVAGTCTFKRLIPSGSSQCEKKHTAEEISPSLSHTLEPHVFRPLQQSASRSAMACQRHRLRFDCRQHHARRFARMDPLAVGFLILFGESGAKGGELVGEGIGCEQHGILCRHAMRFSADHGCHSTTAFAGCESLSS